MLAWLCFSSCLEELGFPRGSPFSSLVWAEQTGELPPAWVGGCRGTQEVLADGDWLSGGIKRAMKEEEEEG